MNLLLEYISIHIKIKLQYKISFILTLIAQIFVAVAELVLICSLFDKFNLLETYNIHELILGFSVIWLGYSLAQLFGRGFDKFSKLIITGNFDLLLIRPRNIILQIIGSEIFFEKISRVIGMFVLFIYSSIKILDGFNILKILTLIMMMLGAFLLMLGILIIGASICFYTVQGLEFINIFTDGTKQVSQYPMAIYNKTIRNIFTFILPVTLINYYPIEYLSGRCNEIFYMLTPLVSCAFIVPSLMIFSIGLRKYKSTGS